jgi:asparagine synthase (glutamine-hydrolysing)
MCGICGIVNTSAQAPPRLLLERMCREMAHRGPDDEGVLIRPGVGLASRRLAIMDVPSGAQPMSNDDESVWIAFNGEVYNHPELRERLVALGRSFRTRCDTEVLLRAYEQWGERCVEQLNGMFAFAIWDTRQEKLFLGRDRVGIKPLHYAVHGNQLAFASELKCLLCVPEVSFDVDVAALVDYLRFEYVPTPRTMIRGVQKLAPGHTLTWSIPTATATIDQYWDVDLTRSEHAERKRRPSKVSTGREARALWDVLAEAVRKEMISDVPLGVFVSGGIDSSAVAAAMAASSEGRVKSFNIGFDDPSFDESREAKLVADHLGTDHHTAVLTPSMVSDLAPTVIDRMDEPLGDASIVPTYLLCRFAREHVKVALSGDGGDELFAGYPTLLAHRAAPYYQRLPAPVRRAIPHLAARLPVSHDNISFDFKVKRFVAAAERPLADRHIRWLGSFAPEDAEGLLAAEAHEQLGTDGEHDVATQHLRTAQVHQPLNQVLYLDMKLYLENDILVKLDRASMLASLEARVPLLNRDVVDHVTGLPLELKLRGRQSKRLLKEALRGRVPDSILERPKKGFGIPVARWFRGPLKSELLDALSTERLKSQGLFSPDAVGRLVTEHLDGRRDNRKQLWTLFVFQRWYEACSARQSAASGGRT